MVVKTKKYKKKRYNRRKRTFKKSLRRYRKPRYNPTWNPQFIKVKRQIEYLVPAADLGPGDRGDLGRYGVFPYLSVQPIATTMSYVSAAFNFCILDVYNIQEYGVLFDQYKITGVKLNFKYITASESSLSQSTHLQGQTCELLVVNDNDDVVPYNADNTGWMKAQETGRAYVKMFPSPKKNSMKFYVKPKLLAPLIDGSTGALTARSNLNPWIDGALDEQPYYLGVKCMLRCPPNNTTGFVHTISCTATYYICWRSRH